jgi:hypothetical protein
MNYGWIKLKEGVSPNKQIKYLRFIGVKGNLNIKLFDTGVIVEKCECSFIVMVFLILLWPNFWTGCFTTIDWRGVPLPNKEQLFWKLGSWGEKLSS